MGMWWWFKYIDNLVQTCLPSPSRSFRLARPPRSSGGCSQVGYLRSEQESWCLRWHWQGAVDWKLVHLHETVKEGVPVHVGDVVAMGGVVVREEGDAGHFLMMTRMMMVWWWLQHFVDDIGRTCISLRFFLRAIDRGPGTAVRILAMVTMKKNGNQAM